MAEDKNPYLVRLNKLFHYLKDNEATVNIKYLHNGELNKKTYAPNKKGASLEDLFAHGCEVSGRALKGITGDRTYTESKEIGSNARIDYSQKKIIKNIYFHFKDEERDASPIRLFSENKKDLFQKQNFTDYNFKNIRNTYKDVQLSLKESVISIIKNDYKKTGYYDTGVPDPAFASPDDDFIFLDGHKKWNIKLGSVSGFYQFGITGTLDPDEVDQLNEILSIWENPISAYSVLDPLDLINDMFSQDIFPGLSHKNLPFKNNPLRSENSEHYKERLDKLLTLSDEELYNRLKEPKTWVTTDRYYLLFALLTKFDHQDIESFPSYLHALIILVGAEYSTICSWLLNTAKEEINNIKFSVQYTPDARKPEMVRYEYISMDELCELLEDFHFDSHPENIFEIQHSSILKKPIYRNEIAFTTDFIYDKTEFENSIKGKLFLFFFNELKRHFGFKVQNEEFIVKPVLSKIRREIVDKNRPC